MIVSEPDDYNVGLMVVSMMMVWLVVAEAVLMARMASMMDCNKECVAAKFTWRFFVIIINIS